jgi:hypothetical protein
MSIKEDIGRIFDEQSKASHSFRATLEPVADAPDRVQVTPYDGSGCGCDRAMILSIVHLESVERAEDTWHDCCGKRLRVCNVTLKPDATLLAKDLLQQQAGHARTKHAGHTHARFASEGDYQDVTPSGHFHPDRPACSQCWSVAPKYQERCWQTCAGSTAGGWDDNQDAAPSRFHPQSKPTNPCYGWELSCIKGGYPYGWCHQNYLNCVEHWKGP